MFILCTFLDLSGQQMLVNRAWVNQSNLPDAANFPLSQFEVLDHDATIATSDGGVFIVGSSDNGNTGMDIAVQKLDANGTLEWSDTYNGSYGGDDYGTKAFKDNSGHLYLAGTESVAEDSTNLIVIKYSATGTLLWQASFGAAATGSTASSGYQHNVPTALAAASNGDVYLGVTAVNNGGLVIDWMTVKFNSTGAYVWNSVYDQAGYPDFPTFAKAGSNGVLMGGFSSASFGDYDYLQTFIDGTTGSPGIMSSTDLPGLSITDGAGIASDDSGNIYIVGNSANNPGTGQDLQVVSISAQGQYNWSLAIDGYGLKDRARGIVLDTNGNPYVIGESQTQDGRTEGLIAKIVGSEAVLDWKQTYRAPRYQNFATFNDLRYENERLYVAGTSEVSGKSRFASVVYDLEGHILVDKKYAPSEQSDSKSSQILPTSDGYLVTGKSTTGNTETFETVKYEFFEPSLAFDTLSNGLPSHRSSELIVKFDPRVVDSSFVDAQNLEFGSIFNIIDNDSIAQRILDELRLPRDPVFSKVFSRLTTNHTQSYTRLGDTISIPAFWSTFVIHVSEGIDLDQLLILLNGISEVVYAEHNSVGSFYSIPNDPFFPDQHSLYDVSNPDASINVVPAWDIETGADYVKVGIVDSPINRTHQDFSPTGSIEDSRVTDGFNFFSNIPIDVSTSIPSDDHGTATSSIIGARRDNGVGIAGIAGGKTDMNGNFEEGIQLHSMVIGYIQPDAASAAEAIMEGAMNANADPPGFGQHIQNHSWGTDNQNTTLRLQVRFAYKNQCTLIAGRGNEIGESNGLETPAYPASYNDDMVISVGTSGTDGEYYRGVNGNFGVRPYGYRYGDNMDVIAPGVSELVIAAKKPGATGGFPQPFSPYRTFNGTSASAPHVTGLAALMYSYHNIENEFENNLAPDDIEFLIQRYARDIATSSYPVGYDPENGWGMIHAENTMNILEAPNYRIFHNSDDGILVSNILQGIIGSTDDYHIYEYEVTKSYQNIFPSSTQILDTWARNSSSTGINQFPDGDPKGEFTFSINNSTVSVTAKTNIYKLVDIFTGEEEWYPAPAPQVRFGYSVHLYDPTISSTEDIISNNVFAFPNPTSNYVTIQFAEISNIDVIRVIDSTGKSITTIEDCSGSEVTINLENLSPGLYFVKIQLNNGNTIIKKILKN